MDTTTILQKAAKNSIGNIEKAIIEILDFRCGRIQEDQPVSAAGNNLSNSLAGRKDAMDDVARIVRGDALAPSAATALLNNASVKTYYVQFNPSELRLTGFGGGRMLKTNFSDTREENSDQAGGMSYGGMKARIEMEVKLIFDRVDPQDAFMADKWNASATALATGTAKAALSAAGKQEYSVQKEVEGFIAALRSSRTRRITFAWGKMCYSGVLNRVGSQYTMFNVQGVPIRAEVSLSLICADKDISPNSMGTWEAQYEKAFRHQNQSYVQAAQKAGNILNFGL